MKRYVKTAILSAIAVFLLAFASGNAKAVDIPEKQAKCVNADSGNCAEKAKPAEKKVSLIKPAVETTGFPMLEKIRSDVTTMLQKKIEVRFTRQIEEMLFEQITK
ncbi:MAG TPA: hypothetical protein VM425_20075 [Myxococcota bacterium]|nr:hypothetical protein [Myxococcota bacterium]